MKDYKNSPDDLAGLWKTIDAIDKVERDERDFKRAIMALLFSACIFGVTFGGPAPVQQEQQQMRPVRNLSRQVKPPDTVPEVMEHDLTVVNESGNFWTFAGGLATAVGVALAGYFGARAIRHK